MLELCNEIYQLCEGTNGIQNNSAGANFRRFLNGGSVTGQLQSDMTDTYENEMRANPGNPLPHPHRDLDAGAALKAELCGQYIWIRRASIPEEEGPDGERVPAPHTLPNFAEIDTIQELARNEDVPRQFVDRFVDEYVYFGIHSNKSSAHDLIMVRKLYADREGQVLKKGGPKLLSPRGFGGRNEPEYPLWLVYCLCQVVLKHPEE